VQANERTLAAKVPSTPAAIQGIVHWAERRKLVSAHVPLLCEQFRTYSLHTSLFRVCFFLLRDFQDSFDVLSVVNKQIYSGMCCRVVWYEVTIFAEEMCVFISQNSPIFWILMIPTHMFTSTQMRDSAMPAYFMGFDLTMHS